MADEFDELLDDFGRRPTFLKRLLYLFLGLEAVATTAFLFVRIFLIDLSASQVTLSLAVITSTVILSLSYHNLAFAKAARIRRVAAPPTKGAFKSNPAEFSAAQKAFEGKISSASIWYSCAYNNAIYMLVTPLLANYLLAEKVGGDLNLLLSGGAAAGLALYNSNTALKAIGE